MSKSQQKSEKKTPRVRHIVAGTIMGAFVAPVIAFEYAKHEIKYRSRLLFDRQNPELYLRWAEGERNFETTSMKTEAKRLSKGIERCGPDTELLARRGTNYHCRGMFAEAEKDFEQLLTVDPSQTFYIDHLVESLHGQGKPLTDAAQGFIEEHVAGLRSRVDQDDGYVDREIGMYSQILGNHQEAVDAYTRFIESPAGPYDAHQLRIEANTALGDADAIEKDLDVLVEETDDRWADWRIRRGMFHLKQGNIEAALDDLEKAVEIDDYHMRAHWQLGRAYEVAGDHDAAVASIGKAVEIYQKLESEDFWPDMHIVGGGAVSGDFDGAYRRITLITSSERDEMLRDHASLQ